MINYLLNSSYNYIRDKISHLIYGNNLEDNAQLLEDNAQKDTQAEQPNEQSKDYLGYIKSVGKGAIVTVGTVAYLLTLFQSIKGMGCSKNNNNNEEDNKLSASELGFFSSTENIDSCPIDYLSLLGVDEEENYFSHDYKDNDNENEKEALTEEIIENKIGTMPNPQKKLSTGVQQLQRIFPEISSREDTEDTNESQGNNHTDFNSKFIDLDHRSIPFGAQLSENRFIVMWTSYDDDGKEEVFERVIEIEEETPLLMTLTNDTKHNGAG